MHEFPVETRGESAVVRPSGPGGSGVSLFGGMEESFAAALRAACGMRKSRIVVDFSRTEWLSSAAIRYLLLYGRVQSAHGGDLVFSHVSEGLLAPMRECHLTDLYEVHESNAAACI